MTNKTGNRKDSAIPVVLGGGARRGAYLLGFLQLLEEVEARVAYFLCVSIGSFIGVLYTNGLSLTQIGEIMQDELFKNHMFAWANPFNWLRNGWREVTMWTRILLPPLNWKRWVGFGLMDMLPLMQEVVAKYDLHWNSRFRLVAFDLQRRLPVILQMAADGEPERVVVEEKVVRIYLRSQEHLAIALAASCCVCGPGMMRPIAFSLDGHDFLLVDGGFFHPQPGLLTDSESAVVAKLIDVPLSDWVFTDRDDDFVVDLADPLEPYFSALSASDVQRMQKAGYRRTRTALRLPVLHGLIPADKPHVLNPA